MTRTETVPDATSASAADRLDRLTDAAPALRAFLAIDACARLLLWAGAFALTTAAFTAIGAWPPRGPVGADLRLAWTWGVRLSLWLVLFNVVYLAELLLLRLMLPTPREGRYRVAPGRVPNRQLLWATLLAVLTKARYQAPFPAFLVGHLASVGPLRWPVAAILGPQTRSCNVTDPEILDPHLVSIGRNVVIGYRALIAGHHQERDSVTFRRTVIEDGAVIGGNAVVLDGVRVGAGAMIGAGAVVLPNTVIGANEFWAGVPARKIRDLEPLAPRAAVEKDQA